MNFHLEESESSQTWHLWGAWHAIPMEILTDIDLQNAFTFAEYS